MAAFDPKRTRLRVPRINCRRSPQSPVGGIGLASQVGSNSHRRHCKRSTHQTSPHCVHWKKINRIPPPARGLAAEKPIMP